MHLWDVTGPQIAKVAKEVSELLASHKIPNLIAGGIAVQLHGYPRFTTDVDLVVPDVQAAHELLKTLGYRASVHQPLAVIDPETNVRIDLLPAGQALSPACNVPFPTPLDASAVMVPVTIE